MRISIITVNYNNLKGLRETVQSVENQDYIDFEYLIIDGNSTDGSKEFVLALNERGRIGISEPDKGIYDAMNKAISIAKGDYCIFMNSGDVFFSSTVLTKVAQFLNGEDIVSGIGTLMGQTWYPPKEDEISLAFFCKKSMNHQATFIRTQLLKNMPYDCSYKIVADHDFFFRALILNNATYKHISVLISKGENAGASGKVEDSMKERYKALSDRLPPRMKGDLLFIKKYYNPLILVLGNWFYCKFLRSIHYYYSTHKINRR